MEAAEMTPIDPSVGEFRVHYAGFFDPGFGTDEAHGKGSQGRAGGAQPRDAVHPGGRPDRRAPGLRAADRAAHPPLRRPRVALPTPGPQAIQALQSPVLASRVGVAIVGIGSASRRRGRRPLGLRLGLHPRRPPAGRPRPGGAGHVGGARRGLPDLSVRLDACAAAGREMAHPRPSTAPMPPADKLWFETRADADPAEIKTLVDRYGVDTKPLPDREAAAACRSPSLRPACWTSDGVPRSTVSIACGPGRRR
jgi:hypothetical protein